MVDDDRTGPRAAALMNLNMLVETVGGQNYTATKYERWLREAGFDHVRHVPLPSAPGANRIIIATAP